ncbi:protein Skeletor, isoforms B/C isoform X2 [Diabrotica undecimpunctata]|uniref:protein Skeletor, isoforms B/C isoform X2 n=1 Tax=Diabrotica undecimpunctata TaxID=50387 RepID=UPI003B63CB88
MASFWAVFVFGVAFTLIENCHGAQYFGKLIGKLSELHHGVSGEVYAVDARTLYIKDFTYDGQGPAAYFYASVHKAADKHGFRMRDETGSGEVIRRYRKEGITLTLPEGKTIHNIKIFYLWCEEFDVNFGDVKVPRGFDYPRPQKIEALKGVHAISSDNIVIVDAQTLLIPNLSYDGEAPDAKFWVGRGSKPTPQGIRVPDENGKEVPLRRYDRKTVVLTLPGDLTVFDIGHFGIWCEMFTVDFGHVLIPQELNIPPSLKMLGVSPQKLHQVQAQKEPSTTGSSSRPFVGGHLQATTYRPPSLFQFFGIGRRNDDVSQQNSISYVPNEQLRLQQQQQSQYQPFNQVQQTVQNQYQDNQGRNQQIYHTNNYQQSQEQKLLELQQLHRFGHLQQNTQFQYQQQLKPQINYAQQNVDIKPSISLQFPQNFAQEQISRRSFQPEQVAQYSNIPQANFAQHHQNRRQYEEQQVYDRLLQEKKLQEEQQLRAQLNRQYNRFQLNGNYNHLG